MIRWARIGLTAGMLLAPALAGWVLADEARPGADAAASTAAVQAGDYRDLTWFRKLKVRTAPYVNPNLLKQSAVAYKYDPQALLKAAGWDEVYTGLKSGQIALGKKLDDGSYEVLSPEDPAWRDVVMKFKEAGKWSGIVVMSHANQAFGHRPSGQLVTWEAGGPPR